ncbi:hypothetical protein [Rhodoluna sp.]|uniref:hypothetical protein n=1 Tax=Rhodoluna sp. TaxID=1969481 RepID=UPI0025F18348|nr:hypothetical protein [Rhodoluna sp.]
MNNTRIRAIALGAAALTALSAMVAVAPAQAADFSVTADKSVGLNAAGDTVNVTLNNLPADTGVYVRLCAGSAADALKARPTSCFGQGAWASNAATSIAQHASDASKPIALAVQASFVSGTTAVNCLTQACSIHIRRDHLNPTDFSLDRVVPVTFADLTTQSATAAVVAKKLAVTLNNVDGEKVVISVSNKKYTRVVKGAVYVAKLPLPANKKLKAATVVVVADGIEIYRELVRLR